MEKSVEISGYRCSNFFRTCMARFQFELATPADDEELRGVLARTPMDGEMVVSFRREPSYFAAGVVAGPFRQTVVGRDSQCGRIVGFGERSIRDCYVNGVPRPVGYLSSLRVLPEYRNIGLIARGYRFFRELDTDGRTTLYLTTIAEGNQRALAMLTSGRAGLPAYHDAGRFLTLAVPAMTRRLSVESHPPANIRPATPVDLPAVLAFLRTEGPRRQFFPCLDEADFCEPDCMFRNLAVDDVLLALRDGQIVGTLGVWDQRSFRQSVVERYGTRLRWLRPWYNLQARLRTRPLLPRVGEPLEYAVAALPVVAKNDREVFAALLAAAAKHIAPRSISYLLVGLHESDPLLPEAERRATAQYVTRLYHVCWPDAGDYRQALGAYVPYLELGTL
jgi:hypothetical protein